MTEAIMMERLQKEIAHLANIRRNSSLHSLDLILSHNFLRLWILNFDPDLSDSKTLSIQVFDLMWEILARNGITIHCPNERHELFVYYLGSRLAA